MNESELEKIGLTRNQSSVYLSLLKLGSTTAQNIIRESGLHRAIVYDCLEQLHEMGLVSFVVRDFRKYFQAAEPKKLLDYLDEKKEIVNHLLPELEKLKSMKTEEISASIYKGKEGIKTIHSEMLREGKDVYVLGAKGKIFKELPYFIPNFERERVRKRIKFILIYDRKEFRKYEEEVVKRSFFKGKTLPRNFESDSVVNIFGNKVAIASWDERYPTGFMIENKKVADSFRKWFRFMYGCLK